MIENKLSVLLESDLDKIVGGDNKFKQNLEDFGKGFVNGVASIPIIEYALIAKTNGIPQSFGRQLHL